MHHESASQILQSFIGAGGGNAVPKEEPDMDHDEVSEDKGSNGRF